MALLVVALASSCKGIDDTLLATPDASGGSSGPDDGGGANGGMGGLAGGPGPVAMDAGGTANQDAGPVDAGETDAGDDAGAAPGCRPNPDATDEVCTEICPERCNGTDDDCDLRIDEDTDAACPAAHGTALCVQGECVVVLCDGDYRDCDGEASNGCEISTTDDPEHCGGCGKACVLDHASAACDQGLACAIDACEAGYDDCDAHEGTGCETSLRTLTNCGGCASEGAAEACTGLPHAATSDCATEACVITGCGDDWQDCDLDAANGCERRLSTVGPCTPDTDCDWVTFGNNDYYLCRDARTWADARAHCSLILRGELVAIEDDTEDSFVRGLAEGPTWIGANDLVHADLWAWSRNAVPFWRGGAAGEAVEARYAAWASGEPVDGVHCASVTSSGVDWFADDCGTPQAYLCEVVPDGCAGDALKSEPGQCGCGTPDDDFDDDGIAFCDDACTSDPMKAAAGVCGCGTPDVDSDLDGTADCVDGCPGDGNKASAGACGCGTPDDDGDGDGAEDCVDGCDGDPLKTSAGVCGCGVGDTDTDSDGSKDCNDGCDSDANKTAPGTCGCGNPDTDVDGDGTKDCNDGCANDPGKTSPGVCDCGAPETDVDGDGTLDCVDGCPNDTSKIAMGACGCGTPDLDTDGDGSANCVDQCDDDPDKSAPGTCGCGAPDADSDGDDALDCNDACDDDPDKTAPGQCGCGVAETDTDGDGAEDCDDLCPMDMSKTEPGICGCGMPDGDADGDGTPNCSDQCPMDAAKTVPGTCGCGTSESDTDGDGTQNCLDGCPGDANKTMPETCGCGIPETDADMNGVPDCDAQCPDDPFKTDPGVCGCGTPDDDSDGDGFEDCIDACVSDADKQETGICGCGVADDDSDSDGSADCIDACDLDASKTLVGVCGCGVPETDGDGDGFPDCIDDCDGDPGKQDAGDCGCGMPDVDSDGDGTADCIDQCPSNTGKTAPGVCGCGTPDTDTDSDGTPNCNDLCPNDMGKTMPGVCGCGTPDTDSDSDGTPSCNDGCPNDSSKTAPGVCGCGTPDTDGDGDGSADCHDGCPSDSGKTSAGACGCGTPDTDGDGDGAPDCNDGCPADSSKTAPGACGCGTPDTDADGDGTASCVDGCPSDAGKTTPGACGCGAAETDTDGDGSADCVDLCDNDATKTAPGTCGCGTADVDTDGDGSFDCIDGCDGDADKTMPGQCGCGVADGDADSDGSADCVDECDTDPDKSLAGLCGCGIPESVTDTDSDGYEDCLEVCDGDPDKQDPGLCGCGVPDDDTDTDGDGTPDCVDGCALDPGRTELGTCGCIGEANPAPEGTACSDGLGCAAQVACDGAGSCGFPGDCGPTGGTCTRKTYAGMASEGYWHCTDERTWSSAQSACASDGMELAHVHDAVENAAIGGWALSAGAAAWLGADDPAANQRWVWDDDDTLFSIGATAQGGNYTSWGGGEPNGAAGGCLEVTTTATWSDATCGSLRDYVCEIPKRPDPKRKKITIAGSDTIGAVGAQTDFPVLVRITDADLATNAFPSGRDIHFEDDTGHTLPFERERYDSGTGTLVAWVQIDLTGNDQDFYLYYGDGDVTEKSTSTSVWDASYDGVWHLENVASLTDSAGTYAGTNAGSTNVTGIIGRAADFTTTTYIALPAAALSRITGPSTSKIVTFSFWAESDTTNQLVSVFGADENVHATDLGSRIFNLHFPYADGVIYWDCDTETGFNRLQKASGGGASPPWAHWAVTMNNTTGEQKIYRNGAIWAGPATDSNYPLDRTVGRFTLGAERPALNSWDGRVDEFRVSRVERSANWLATEYNNQKSDSTFLAIGAEEDTTSPSSFVQTVTLDNAIGPALTNHQVALVIDATNADFWNHLASSDGRDLRVKTTGGADLDFFVEKLDTSAREALLWVEVPSAAAASTGSYELHYGDPALATVSNGNATFVFFDDFGDGTLDGSKWTTVNPNAATFVESGGALTVTGVGCCGDWWNTAEDAGYVVNTSPISGDYVSETRVTDMSHGAHNRSLGLRSGSAANEKMYVLKCDGDCSHVTTAWRTTVAGAAAEGAENSGIAFPGDDLLATFVVSGGTANVYYGDERAGSRTSSGWGLDHVALSDTVHPESCTYDWTRVRKYAAASGLASDCSLARDHDGHRYVHCTTGRSWTSARDMCAAAGGYLVEIDDAAENAFVDGINGSAESWIGANDRGTEAVFAWARATDSAGGVFCTGNNPCTAVAGAYTNWESGQPNNANGAEDCSRMAASGGKWWDHDCAVTTLASVCELGAPSLTLDDDELVVRP